MWGLSLIDTLLPVWIIVSMVVGVVIGYYAPNVQSILGSAEFAGVSIPVAIGLLVMMYPVFCKVHYEELLTLYRGKLMTGQFLFSFLVNWLFAPLLMTAIAWATLPDLSEYRSGVILVGTARCIAMVLVWNHLAKGHEDFCAILVAFNSVLQMGLYGPLSYFLVVIVGKGSHLEINMWIIVRSVLIYMGIPLVAGFVTRTCFKRFSWYNKYFLPIAGKFTLIALVYVIIVMFALQGHEIIADIKNVVRTAVPLLVYFFLIFPLIMFISYKLKLPYCLAVVQGLTAASNNFELAIAVAIGSFGVKSKEALAATIGPLIEVPVLLILVYVAKFLEKRWPNFYNGYNSLCDEKCPLPDNPEATDADDECGRPGKCGSC